MGKKRRQTAATVRDAMTVQYHLMRQREQYHGTRDEARAAYAKGAADMCQRAVRLVGEHPGPAPMLPYLPEGDGYGPVRVLGVPRPGRPAAVGRRSEGACRLRAEARRRALDTLPRGRPRRALSCR